MNRKSIVVMKSIMFAFSIVMIACGSSHGVCYRVPGTSYYLGPDCLEAESHLKVANNTSYSNPTKISVYYFTTVNPDGSQIAKTYTDRVPINPGSSESYEIPNSRVLAHKDCKIVIQIANTDIYIPLELKSLHRGYQNSVVEYTNEEGETCKLRAYFSVLYLPGSDIPSCMLTIEKIWCH